MADNHLYREFNLKTPDDAKKLITFLKQNAGAFAERGTPLNVIVTEDEPDRLDYQLRYYWGPLLTRIADNAWIDGKQYDKDTWHVHFAKTFLPSQEITLPNGEIEIVRSSVARGKIGQRAMAKYTIQVECFAAQELGISLD